MVAVTVFAEGIVKSVPSTTIFEPAPETVQLLPLILPALPLLICSIAPPAVNPPVANAVPPVPLALVFHVLSTSRLPPALE